MISCCSRNFKSQRRNYFAQVVLIIMKVHINWMVLFASGFFFLGENIWAQTNGIYVSDDSGRIERFDTNGIGSFYASTGNGPAGVAFDRAGNLYVANSSDGTIQRIMTNGTSSTFSSGLNNPWAIAFDGAGNLYVANSGDSTIWRIPT